MKFRTLYSEPVRAHSNAGSEWQDTYKVQIGPNGQKVLKKSGRENIRDRIQASAEDVKVENIVARASMGDEAALSVTNGAYIDTTEMPKSLAEMQQMIINVTDEFYKLPVETRAKFDHSPEKYIAEWGSETWGEKIGLKKEVLNIEPEHTTEIRGESNESGHPAIEV